MNPLLKSESLKNSALDPELWPVNAEKFSAKMALFYSDKGIVVRRQKMPDGRTFEAPAWIEKPNNTLASGCQETWKNICITFNHCIINAESGDSSRKYVLSPFTGIGKTICLPMYLSFIISNIKNYDPGVVIVTQRINDKNPIRLFIRPILHFLFNKLSADDIRYGEINHEENKIIIKALNNENTDGLVDASDVHIIFTTHQNFINQINTPDTEEHDRLFKYKDGENRKLIIIDEALSLTHTKSSALNKLSSSKNRLSSLKNLKDNPKTHQLCVINQSLFTGKDKKDETLDKYQHDVNILESQPKQGLTVTNIKSIATNHLPSYVALDATARLDPFYKLLKGLKFAKTPAHTRNYNNLTIHHGIGHNSRSDINGNDRWFFLNELIEYIKQNDDFNSNTVIFGYKPDKSQGNGYWKLFENFNIHQNHHGNLDKQVQDTLRLSDSNNIQLSNPYYAWHGSLDGINIYKDMKHIIFHGFPYLPDYLFKYILYKQHKAELTTQNKHLSIYEFDHDDIYNLRNQYLAARLIQAINRIRCRSIIDTEGNCAQSHAYLLFNSEEQRNTLLHLLETHLPKVRIEEWSFKFTETKDKDDGKRHFYRYQINSTDKFNLYYKTDSQYLEDSILKLIEDYPDVLKPAKKYKDGQQLKSALEDVLLNFIVINFKNKQNFNVKLSDQTYNNHIIRNLLELNLADKCDPDNRHRFRTSIFPSTFLTEILNKSNIQADSIYQQGAPVYKLNKPKNDDNVFQQKIENKEIRMGLDFNSLSLSHKYLETCSQMTEVCNKMNAIYQKHTFSLDTKPMMKPYLYRVFSRIMVTKKKANGYDVFQTHDLKFKIKNQRVNSIRRKKTSIQWYEQATRFYCLGDTGSSEQNKYGLRYQQLSGTDKVDGRPAIFIDDEPTLELDFSSMHLRILYSLAGYTDNDLIAAGLDLKDLYKLLDDDDDWQIWRKHFKSIYKYYMFCDSFKNAVGGIKEYLNDYENQDFADKFSLKQILDLLKTKHTGLLEDGNHYFFGGAVSSCFLQHLDSLVMEKILEYYIDKEEPALPVHDSVIVKETDNAYSTLQSVMKNSYSSIFGDGHSCFVKR